MSLFIFCFIILHVLNATINLGVLPPAHMFMYDNITFGNRWNANYNPQMYRIGIDCLYYVNYRRHTAFGKRDHHFFRIECVNLNVLKRIQYDARDYRCSGDIINEVNIRRSNLYVIHDFNCQRFTGTYNPTSSPTNEPTNEPTIAMEQDNGVYNYSIAFDSNETVSPTNEPTNEPSIEPTKDPTLEIWSETGTNIGTIAPTLEPTLEPTTEPTLEPTEPTLEPTIEPTLNDYLPQGNGVLSYIWNGLMSIAELCARPVDTPSDSTSDQSLIPTLSPTLEPTNDIFTDLFALSTIYESSPTESPTNEPTLEPTLSPTIEPTAEPTSNPTMEPVISPDVADDETFRDRVLDLMQFIWNRLLSTDSWNSNHVHARSTTFTLDPTISPTLEPTLEPVFDDRLTQRQSKVNKLSGQTISPSIEPTIEPSVEPTVEPTINSNAAAMTYMRQLFMRIGQLCSRSTHNNRDLIDLLHSMSE